jgi:hypothetical protein
LRFLYARFFECPVSVTFAGDDNRFSEQDVVGFDPLIVVPNFSRLTQP